VCCCFAFVVVGAYLVVGLDVQLDLFAGEGADSGWIGQLVAPFVLGERVGGVRRFHLICMVGEVGGCVVIVGV
jgi:hypothetical protein